MTDKQNTDQIRVLSLFSGCGGMDLGFEGGFEVANLGYLDKTSFTTVFANDIKPSARAAWVNYFGKKGTNADVYELDSIVNLVKKHKNQGGVFPENIDIVTGGFPCQDFSVAGKRLGFSSDKCDFGKKLADNLPSIENRGRLYMWMREVISIV